MSSCATCIFFFFFQTEVAITAKKKLKTLSSKRYASRPEMSSYATCLPDGGGDHGEKKVKNVAE
jgi:hypothetical protein